MKGLHIVLCLCLVALVGCATPAQRIAKNPELFASFPEEAQAKIQKGMIDVGFTKPMVEMALGQPDRIYTRQTESNTQEIWSYVTVREYSSPSLPVYHRRNRGVYYPPRTIHRREIERLRVIFSDDGVAEIHSLNQL